MYIVRVELHAANSQDYDKLHAAMKSRAFSRTIKSDEGVQYHLPTAEYLWEGAKDASADDVLAAAKAAASSAKSSYAVLCSRASEISFSGLARV